jgi:ParB-like chromosome segregation protein Spo0J
MNALAEAPPGAEKAAGAAPAKSNPENAANNELTAKNNYLSGDVKAELQWGAADAFRWAFGDDPEAALEVHPAANVFPLLSKSKLIELAEEIGGPRGLIEPIELYRGQILDGRNRYLACRIANVEPRFKDYTGDDPWGHSMSKNLVRRHLCDGWRAIQAARWANVNGWGEREEDYASLRSGEKEVTQAEAAQFWHVSLRLVSSAARVLKSGDAELISKVERGTLTASAAAATLRPRAKKKSQVEKAKQRKKMLNGGGKRATKEELMGTLEVNGTTEDHIERLVVGFANWFQFKQRREALKLFRAWTLENVSEEGKLL